MPTPLEYSPETISIAINLYDRLKRRVVLVFNLDQKCCTASWVEEDPALKFDKEMDGVELFKKLFVEPPTPPNVGTWLMGVIHCADCTTSKLCDVHASTDPRVI